MGKFTFHRTEIEGVMVVDPTVYGDERGWFMETYNYEAFREGGIPNVFVQDNQSVSSKGVLRGLHFQWHYQQAKLVRVLKGKVYDVAVDLRKGSGTWGKYIGVTLSGEDKRQFFIPKGFAHGFLVLSDEAEFSYKCDEPYHPEDEGGVSWNDPMIGIKWPEVNIGLNLSAKDAGRTVLKKYGEILL